MNDPNERAIGVADFNRYFARNIESAKELQPFSVLIAGLGTTGSASASELAKAGVGSLILFDPDVVEVENLHRQHMSARFLGMNKAAAMAETLRAEVSTGQSIGGFWHDIEEVDYGVLCALVSFASLVIAATGNDTADARLNRACRDENIPLIVPSLYPDTWTEDVGVVQVIDWSDPNRRGSCFECTHRPRQGVRAQARRGLAGQQGQPMDLWPVANFTTQLAVGLLTPDSPRGRWLARELASGFTEFQIGRLVPQVSPTRTTPASDCPCCNTAPATTNPAPARRRVRPAAHDRHRWVIARRFGALALLLALLSIGTYKGVQFGAHFLSSHRGHAAAETPAKTTSPTRPSAHRPPCQLFVVRKAHGAQRYDVPNESNEVLTRAALKRAGSVIVRCESLRR